MFFRLFFVATLLRKATFEQVFKNLHAGHFLRNLEQLVGSPKIISISWISTIHISTVCGFSETE